MADSEKRGITVKVDAELHAEVKRFIESNNMTMAEFVAQALEDELHPKIQEKEETTMANMRTLAFQVPEDLFQKIKEYLRRNNMTQKEFVIGLIENEIERDLAERNEQENASSKAEDEEEEILEETDEELEEDLDEELEYELDETEEGIEELEEESEESDEEFDEQYDEDEEESEGMSLGM